jgi:hypothetical protein
MHRLLFLGFALVALVVGQSRSFSFRFHFIFLQPCKRCDVLSTPWDVKNVTLSTADSLWFVVLHDV